MEVERFFELTERLTGSPVKGTTETDKGFLREALSDDRKRIDVSQFNELLLLANKDRVKPPFFAYFFSTSRNSYCRIADMEDGVLRFQKVALLCFGNFLHAYRRLSRAATQDALLQEVGRHGCDPKRLIRELKQRQPKVLDIEPISRDETYLIGYLSAGQIIAEDTRARWMLSLLKEESLNRWEDVQEAVEGSAVDKDQKKALLSLISRFLRKTSQKAISSGLKGSHFQR